MENIHFLSFPLRGEKEMMQGEREVLKSVGVCDCNRVGRWLCVCVSAYWEGRQNAAI